MAATTSYATTFAFGSTIGEVIDIKLDGIKVKQINTSHLTSTAACQTFANGMIDAGGFTLKINYVKAQFSTVMNYLRSTQSWLLTLPDSSTLAGSGNIEEIGLTIPEDDRIEVDIKIKISGAPAFTSS